MEFTPIGILALVAAALIIARPTALGLPVIASFVPLQAAAFVNLPAFGDVSIISAHVLIGAFFVGIALRPKLANAALQFASGNAAIMLFGVFVVYAVWSAFMMPRLFEGEVEVYSLERSGLGFIPLTPLHPSSGNITQSFYIAVNFLMFAAVVFLISRRGGLKAATHAFNAMIVVHLFFAVISAVPQFPPFGVILDSIRTANYSINAHHTIAGMPRIIGSYTEPAAFGAMSMGLFAWSFLRFMQTRGVWYFCSSSLLLVCAAASFSTTAYAALLLLIGIWGLHSLYYMVRRGITQDHITALVFGGLVAAGMVMLFFFEPIQAFGADAYERLFGEKLLSASGRERAAWNAQGWLNLVETNGFGVGLGSARTSSLATVLLSNVGVVGALFYVMFLSQSFLRPWGLSVARMNSHEHRYARRIFTAARAGALALLIAQVISGTTIDGGLMYILLAATATAAYIPAIEKKSRYVFDPIGGDPNIAQVTRQPAYAALFGPRKSEDT